LFEISVRGYKRDPTPPASIIAFIGQTAFLAELIN